MPVFNIIVIILRWRNNSDNLKTILKWMLAISSMESYPVGKENLSSGQGPLTLRKKVLGARDRGATATERHAQQEWRTPLPKITELASYMAEASRFRSSCCFPSSNITCHSQGVTSDRPPPGRKCSGERALCLSHFSQESSGQLGCWEGTEQGYGSGASWLRLTTFEGKTDLKLEHWFQTQRRGVRVP